MTINDFDKETCQTLEKLTEGLSDKLEHGAEELEHEVVETYEKIEKGVVDAYKKVEEGAVGAYKKVEDFFVEKLFTKEGETVEEAKARLRGEDHHE